MSGMPVEGGRLHAAALLLLCLAGGAAGCGPAAEIRAEPEIRVGLTEDATRVAVSSPSGIEVADTSGRPVIRAGGADDRVLARGPGGRLLHLGPGGPVALGRGPLLVRSISGPWVRVDGKPFRGSVQVGVNRRGRLSVVNRLPLEAYLAGVLPRELGEIRGPELEAARAQAVAARTYAISRILSRRDEAFDVVATTADQVYGGAAVESPLLTRAVETTRGTVLLHDGRPIEALYHSTCAGRTATVEEVWGRDPVPYLRSASDLDPRTGRPYDSFSSRFRWEVEWPGPVLEGVLAETVAEPLGELRDLKVLSRSASGRVERLLVRGAGASVVLRGDHIRRVLRTPGGSPLNSLRFALRLDRAPDGRLVRVAATGGGWGHGVGMCQTGAIGRARQGQDHRAILEAYYADVELADLY